MITSIDVLIKNKDFKRLNEVARKCYQLYKDKNNSLEKKAGALYCIIYIYYKLSQWVYCKIACELFITRFPHIKNIDQIKKYLLDSLEHITDEMMEMEGEFDFRFDTDEEQERNKKSVVVTNVVVRKRRAHPIHNRLSRFVRKYVIYNIDRTLPLVTAIVVINFIFVSAILFYLNKVEEISSKADINKKVSLFQMYQILKEYTETGDMQKAEDSLKDIWGENGLQEFKNTIKKYQKDKVIRMDELKKLLSTDEKDIDPAEKDRIIKEIEANLPKLIKEIESKD
ncbi:MAG: hypothetical protein AB1765_02510 [Candidatus Hydrogenedentota bacterium]